MSSFEAELYFEGLLVKKNEYTTPIKKINTNEAIRIILVTSLVDES